MVDPAEEYQLVVRAFQLARGGRTGYVTGYADWDPAKAEIARSKLADLNGLTPEAVRELAIDFVCGGGQVIQSVETREEWLDYPFKYVILLPVPDFPRPIYVELILIDEDPNDPAILFVSAHKQGV